MNEPIVRAATGADCLHLAGCLEALSPCPSSPAELASLLRVRDAANILTVVCTLGPGGIPAGTASLLLERKMTRGGALAGRIEDVAVRPSMQDRGVGAAMVAALVSAAWRLGCYKVTLACDERLEGFYAKAGFYENGTEMRADP